MSRYEIHDQGQEFESEYDIPTAETIDVEARGIGPVKVFTQPQINLATGGTLFINEPGYGFILYAQNASNGKIYEEAFMNVFVNRGDASDTSVAFPCKSGRGYVGAFEKLFLQWPLDSSGTYNLTFVVFKSKLYPWTGGEEAE